MTPHMTQAEMIDKLNAATGIGRNKAEDAIRQTLQIISNALAEGREVRFMGFGTFRTVMIAPRPTRSLKTGETVMSKGGNRVKFKPSPQLKNLVQK